jgi:hypothetical protein
MKIPYYITNSSVMFTFMHKLVTSLKCTISHCRAHLMCFFIEFSCVNLLTYFFPGEFISATYKHDIQRATYNHDIQRATYNHDIQRATYNQDSLYYSFYFVFYVKHFTYNWFTLCNLDTKLEKICQN